MSHAVDDFSECKAGLEVEISPPLGMLGEPDAAQHYLADDHTARAEIARHHADLVTFYERSERTHEQLPSPFRITAAATLPWARSRIGLARRAAARLDVYFEAMHIVVEQIDLGLAEIAN